MIVNPMLIFREGIIIDALRENIQPNGIDIRIDEEVALPPHSFINVLCIESVKIPKLLCAQIIQRSSFSRKGVFLTTGLWDSGFEGRLGCSIYNMSNEAIFIKKSERVGQIIFHEADSAGMYDGKWQNHGSEPGKSS